MQRGKPVRAEGRDLQRRLGCRRGRVADRPVVPLKPGNAGGGKGPDFWVRFDEDEVRGVA